MSIEIYSQLSPEVSDERSFERNETKLVAFALTNVVTIDHKCCGLSWRSLEKKERMMKNRIVKFREKAGLSQSELARRIGTTRQQMGRLERGERKLTPDWALRIALEVSCSPQDLIVWSEVEVDGEGDPGPGAIVSKEGRGSRLDAFAFRLTENEIVTGPAVANALGVTLHNLAGLIGVPMQLLETESASARLEVDHALRPVLVVLAMASEMAGGEDRAAIWFKHQPIPGWAGKTAYDLVGEGKADKVLAYLEAVRSGVYA